jgi:hypothetical protein
MYRQEDRYKEESHNAMWKSKGITYNDVRQRKECDRERVFLWKR